MDAPDLEFGQVCSVWRRDPGKNNDAWLCVLNNVLIKGIGVADFWHTPAPPHKNPAAPLSTII